MTGLSDTELVAIERIHKNSPQCHLVDCDFCHVLVEVKKLREVFRTLATSPEDTWRAFAEFARRFVGGTVRDKPIVKDIFLETALKQVKEAQDGFRMCLADLEKCRAEVRILRKLHEGCEGLLKDHDKWRAEAVRLREEINRKLTE